MFTIPRIFNQVPEPTTDDLTLKCVKEFKQKSFCTGCAKKSKIKKYDPTDHHNRFNSKY